MGSSANYACECAAKECFLAAKVPTTILAIILMRAEQEEQKMFFGFGPKSLNPTLHHHSLTHTTRHAIYTSNRSYI